MKRLLRYGETAPRPAHPPGWAAGLLLLLLAAAGVTLARAQDANRAGLVVVHGDGRVVSQCVEFAEDEITGMELLERSGLDLNVDAASGMGAIVCRLDQEGCAFPAEPCFCQCRGQPCVYWTYWNLDGDQWQFSNLGASSRKLRHGDVDGWRWGESTQSASQATIPPHLTFEEICRPAATPTPPPATDPPPPPPPSPEATAIGRLVEETPAVEADRPTPPAPAAEQPAGGPGSGLSPGLLVGLISLAVAAIAAAGWRALRRGKPE